MTMRLARCAPLLAALLALSAATPALAQGQPADPMQMPMGQMPMGQMPMGQMPMGQMPMGQMPMGQMPMGQMPMGQMPMDPSQMPMGQMPMGQMPMGQMPMGQMPMGQMPMGQMPMGQMPMGQTPMGQTPMGQMPMGQQPGMNPMMQQMLQQALMYEQQSHGVQPTDQLQLQQVHGPTPNVLNGGRVVTTPELFSMLQGGQQVVLVDVLSGPHPTIPGALLLPDAGLGQSLDDQVQQQLKAALDQATGGNPAVPVIFFCQGPQCWLSHNAAVRAIRLGFPNVGWYRGGLEVWSMLGLPVQQAGFQPQPMPQQPVQNWPAPTMPVQPQ